jgi:nucleoid-associated protein YgaU
VGDDKITHNPSSLNKYKEMEMTEKKKGFFAKAIEFLTDREEKEELTQAEEKIRKLDEKIAKETDEKAKAEAREKAAAYLERKRQLKERQDARLIPTSGKHVVVAGDTLTALAQKYYGDAKKYMILYEANKEVIGDDPDMIKIGMELVVPEVK